MNLANAITTARLLVACAVFVCLALLPAAGDARTRLAEAALWLFVLSATTDFLDGYVARAFKQVTMLGRVADPFVDKVLVCGTLIFLSGLPETAALCPAWVVVVIVGREFLVTAVRGIMEARGRPFPADALGKWKMVTQSVAAAAFLGTLARWTWTQPIGTVCLWIALVLTVVSGANYLWKARDVLLS